MPSQPEPHRGATVDPSRVLDHRRDTPATPPARSRRSSAGLGGRSLRTMALLAGVSVAAWLVLVFGSALARSDAMEREAHLARAENAALLDRIAAGRAEIELIQTDAFLSIQARAYGMGEAGERPFALAPDALPAPVIVPLGAAPVSPVATTPLEEWLDLLFG